MQNNNVKILAERFERISLEYKPLTSESSSPTVNNENKMQIYESKFDDDDEFFDCVSTPSVRGSVSTPSPEHEGILPEKQQHSKYTKSRKRDKIKKVFKKVTGHDQASVPMSPNKDFDYEYMNMNKDHSDNVSLKSFSWETNSLRSFNVEFEMMKFIFNESQLDHEKYDIRRKQDVRLSHHIKQKFRNPFKDELSWIETSSGSFDLYSIPIPEEVIPVISELIETETNYVKNLKIGIETYGSIFKRRNLPASLKGKKGDLLGNVEVILEFHEQDLLPMLLRYQHDFQDLVNHFQSFLAKDKFYVYIPYTVNSVKSKKLYKEHQTYFKQLQSEFNDQLGILSFLLQPTQRLPRYSLMFHEITKTLFKVGKSGDCKKLLSLCTLMDKRIRKFIQLVDHSNYLNDVVKVKNISLNEQGKLLAVGDFKCIDYIFRKGYKAKLFLFNKSLVYCEETESKVIFRGSFSKEDIILKDKEFDEFQVSYRRKPQWKCDFSGNKDSFVKALKKLLGEKQHYENMKFRSQHVLLLDPRSYKAVDCDDGINFELSDDESYC